MWMLDTNICIYTIKRKPPSVRERLVATPMDQVIVSSVTLGELRYGVEKSNAWERNLQVLKHFLSHVAVIAWDDSAVLHYGEIRADLERRGIPIGGMDLMIAAHARSLQATLVTHNSREFQKVPSLTWLDFGQNNQH